MSNRTKDQILDQAVHAVQCVSRHYGPGFNELGLTKVRDMLSTLLWWADAEFLVDVRPGDEYEDFHQRIIWPDGWDKEEPPC